MTHITCKLTAKNRDQLRKPTLGNRVWATFTFSSLQVAARCRGCCLFRRPAAASESALPGDDDRPAWLDRAHLVSSLRQSSVAGVVDEGLGHGPSGLAAVPPAARRRVAVRQGHQADRCRSLHVHGYQRLRHGHRHHRPARRP